MNKASISLRTQLFRAVRDIPYKIGSAATDSSCIAKTKLLGELLSRAGFECQVWKAVVRWEDTGIPTTLRSLAPRQTVDHFFLKVWIPENGTWVIVDPTWDQRFSGALPVTEWDGRTDTKLAYQSNQTRLVGSVNDFSYRDFDPNEPFTKQLNEWYDSIAKRKNDRKI